MSMARRSFATTQDRRSSNPRLHRSGVLGSDRRPYFRSGNRLPRELYWHDYREVDATTGRSEPVFLPASLYGLLIRLREIRIVRLSGVTVFLLCGHTLDRSDIKSRLVPGSSEHKAMLDKLFSSRFLRTVGNQLHVFDVLTSPKKMLLHCLTDGRPLYPTAIRESWDGPGLLGDRTIIHGCVGRHPNGADDPCDRAAHEQRGSVADCPRRKCNVGHWSPCAPGRRSSRSRLTVVPATSLFMTSDSAVM